MLPRFLIVLFFAELLMAAVSPVCPAAGDKPGGRPPDRAPETARRENSKRLERSTENDSFSKRNGDSFGKLEGVSKLDRASKLDVVAKSERNTKQNERIVAAKKSEVGADASRTNGSKPPREVAGARNKEINNRFAELNARPAETSNRREVAGAKDRRANALDASAEAKEAKAASDARGAKPKDADPVRTDTAKSRQVFGAKPEAASRQEAAPPKSKEAATDPKANRDTAASKPEAASGEGRDANKTADLPGNKGRETTGLGDKDAALQKRENRAGEITDATNGKKPDQRQDNTAAMAGRDLDQQSKTRPELRPQARDSMSNAEAESRRTTRPAEARADAGTEKPSDGNTTKPGQRPADEQAKTATPDKKGQDARAENFQLDWNINNRYRGPDKNSDEIKPPLDHIMEKHGPQSTSTSKSRFADGTSEAQVKGYVDEALRNTKREDWQRDGANGYIVDYRFSGKAIGADVRSLEQPANGLRIHIRDGNLKSAYPVFLPGK